jgi:hypothetical protein
LSIAEFLLMLYAESRICEDTGMTLRRPAPAQNAPSDDFQRAAAEAETKAGERGWFEMSPSEQTRAIYAQLRRIDADRAAAMAFSPGRPGRYRVAGETARRAAAG